MSPTPSGSDDPYLEREWGGSSVGRALRSQCRGRGFDSLPLHSFLPQRFAACLSDSHIDKPLMVRGDVRPFRGLGPCQQRRDPRLSIGICGRDILPLAGPTTPPLVERTRRHPRLKRQAPLGLDSGRFLHSRIATGPQPVAAVRSFSRPHLARRSCHRKHSRHAVLSLQLGAGSSIYPGMFTKAGVFSKLIEQAQPKGGVRFSRVGLERCIRSDPPNPEQRSELSPRRLRAVD